MLSKNELWEKEGKCVALFTVIQSVDRWSIERLTRNTSLYIHDAKTRQSTKGYSNWTFKGWLNGVWCRQSAQRSSEYNFKAASTFSWNRDSLRAHFYTARLKCNCSCITIISPWMCRFILKHDHNVNKNHPQQHSEFDFIPFKNNNTVCCNMMHTFFFPRVYI